KRHSIKHVVLTSFWSYYLLGREFGKERPYLLGDQFTESVTTAESQHVFSSHFRKTVRSLRELGVTVWIVAQVPTHNFDVPFRLSKMAFLGRDVQTVGRPLSEHLERLEFVNSVFNEINDAEVHLIDPAKFFCNENKLCKTEYNGRSLYQDAYHVTRYGSYQLMPGFEPLFQRIAEDRRGHGFDH
ncbi:MAG: SGNH hydrolase domain-containing protein, partial [Gammaproteobacteria bacterium]